MLSPYVDGQTSLPERRAVEAHLGECDLCRAELADLRALKGLLAQLPRREPPRAFVLGPRAVRPAALSGAFSGFVRAATSIAAALAFLAVGMSLFLQG
ncbi:MAG TPA: zf-HC2 domain-containing protein, partial [Chloroflexota bacterium]